MDAFDAFMQEEEAAYERAHDAVLACEGEYLRKNAVPIIGLFYSMPAWKRYCRAYRGYMRAYDAYMKRLGEFTTTMMHARVERVERTDHGNETN